MTENLDDVLEELLTEEGTDATVRSIRKIILLEHPQIVEKISKKRVEEQKQAEKQRVEEERQETERKKANLKMIKTLVVPIVNNRPYKWSDVITEKFVSEYYYHMRDDEISISVETLFEQFLLNMARDLPNFRKETQIFKEKLNQDYVNKTPYDTVMSGKKEKHTFRFQISFAWKV